MNDKEKKDKGIAIVGTIVFHALAVLVLFLMAFKTPLPLPGEEGVEVDLGMMDQGMGNLQPETPAIPMAAQPQQETSKSEEEIVTQNDDEAPALEKPKTTKPKQEQPTETPKPKVNQRALFKGNNDPQAGGSEASPVSPATKVIPTGWLVLNSMMGKVARAMAQAMTLAVVAPKAYTVPATTSPKKALW